MTQPPFAIRGINVCESLSRHSPDQVLRLLHRLTAWNMNTLVVHPQYGYRRHEKLIRDYCAAHGISLVQYLYTTLAFTPDAAPAMLAVDEQQRPYSDRVQCETRLCIAQSQSLRRFREGARRYIAAQLEPNDHLLLATADGSQLCRCPHCRELGAIDQWQPLLEIAVDEVRRSGKPLTTHFIAYIHRYDLPRNMAVFSHIDAVMFDTHPRCRWAALDEDHPTDAVEDMLGIDMPVNRYLLDRLRRWRQAFAGKLYVFENLMIQATLSLPQPSTPALLGDIETLRALGVDGVVYEAYEPGIAAFTDQLAILSRAMLGHDEPYQPTPLDRIARRAHQGDVRLRALAYLFDDALDSPAKMAAHLPTPVLAELAWLVRSFLPAPTLDAWRRIAQLALGHRDRLDWLYITYRLATYLPPDQRPRAMTDAQRRLFATRKPWDYLEPFDDPLAAGFDVIASLAATA